MKAPLVSFLLPNYNNEKVLDLFFKKFLENNTYNKYEFLIVDDGSLDKSLDVIYRWSRTISNMKIIELSHVGITKALNAGLKEVKGNFIIRMDGDATVETKSFVERFLNFYFINPSKIGVITSMVIWENGIIHALGRNVISEEGLHNRGGKILEPIGKRTFDSIVQMPHAKDCKILNQVAEVDTALGVLTFSDTETALQIGGFDENYPLWKEDDDFYLSYRKFNKKVFYLPDIKVVHRPSLRGSRNPEDWSFLKKQKSYLKNYLKKYLPEPMRLFLRKILNWNNTKPQETNPWRVEILKKDYEYWGKKWGFNPINPDINFILSKYKDTEIVWNYDEDRKREGEEIIKAYYEQKRKS